MAESHFLLRRSLSTVYSGDRVLPTEERRDTSRRALAFVAVCLGFFAAILDTTIVNVALPAIRAAFDTSVTNLQWAANAYNIVFAALLLTFGALADRRGGKRAFGWGLVIFVVV